jgi:hypothetical protein
MMAPTTHDLAHARLEAADRLDAAIAALGIHYQAFVDATRTLEQQTGAADLQRYLEVPVILALAKIGLGSFLEQKFVGTPPGLRVAVEHQHQRLGLEGHVRDAPLSASRSLA